jgi:hypothetical protein
MEIKKIERTSQLPVVMLVDLPGLTGEQAAAFYEQKFGHQPYRVFTFNGTLFVHSWVQPSPSAGELLGRSTKSGGQDEQNLETPVRADGLPGGMLANAAGG